MRATDGYFQTGAKGSFLSYALKTLTVLAAGTLSMPATASAAADLWWRDAVIYEVYPRSFQDTNGDSVGDIKGVTARLDYIKSLGVDAIWLTPFYRSPNADWGYDIADYRSVDPSLGTLADVDALIAGARVRGLRVVLDLVLKHTSDQHRWFVASKASRTGPYADWYIWRDPKAGGGPPTNWGYHAQGESWTFAAERGQYYYHEFAPEQPDLN